MRTTIGRFAPNSFQYNGRVALAFIPSLVLLGGFAGKFVVGTLMVGAMFTYIMDMLRLREAAFVSVWTTMVISNLGFLIGTGLQNDRPIILSLGMIATVGSTLMLTGVWSTVQFKWIQLKHPAIVIALERLLLVACLPVGLVVQTWGIAGSVGLGQAPFFMMVFGCVLYYLTMLPMPSSFQRVAGTGIGGRASVSAQVQGKLDGFIAASTITCLPSCMYLASHYGVIFESEHFWSLALLWSIPLLFIAALPDGLWWLASSPQLRQAARAGIACIAGIVAIAGVEFRIIFYSFSQYIPLNPPWSWLVMAIFLYTKAAIVGAHFAGYLESQTGFIIAGGALIVAAGAGGIAAGLPLPVMPCPLIGAGGLALYYDSRQLRDYIIFLAGTGATAVWLMWQHYWFLEIDVAGMSVQMVCQLIAACALVGLIVPGVVLSGARDGLIKVGLEAFLLVQALVLSILEEGLYGNGDDDSASIYPAYLVLFTSILGIGIARRLHALDYISEMCCWLLQCMYIAKLPMLLLPEASLVLPAFAVTVSVSPPFLLSKLQQGNRNGRIQPWQGFVLVGAIISSVLLARFAIFDLIQEYFSPHPAEGLLIGSLFLATSAGCLPLITKCYPNSQPAKRSIALTVAFGILLCILRPPFPATMGWKCPELPFGWCPRLWDERHVPGNDMDDVEIYGVGLSRKEHWPLWLLLTAVMMGLSAATSGIPIQRSVTTRLGYAALGGVSVGAYLALEFFPGRGPLQVSILIATLLACAFLVLIQRPTRSGPTWMPIIAALWGALFPAALLLQVELDLPEIPPDLLRLYPDSPRKIDDDRKAAGRAALLAIYAAQSLLMAFALKLKVSSALKTSGPTLPSMSGSSWRAPVAGGAGFPYTGMASYRSMCTPGGFTALFGSMVSPKVLDRLGRMLRVEGSAGLLFRRLSAEGLGWVPTLGNILAIACFILSIILRPYFGDQHEAIFLLVPILLLLNQDPFLMRGLTDSRRYFPPFLALVCYFFMASMVEIVEWGFMDPDTHLDTSTSLFLVENFLPLLITIPNQASFLKYLWDRKDASGVLLFVFTPLNLIPLFFADLPTVKYGGLVALIAAGIQFFSSRHLRQIGMKMI